MVPHAALRRQTHQVDFCVVGGGLAGLFAAVAAARRGARTVLLHDRPVLGGNASSEIRVWIGGAHGRNIRETGLLEEASLENLARNPLANWQVWDSVLYGLGRCQENLTLLLNCSALDAEVRDGRLIAVTGWQPTTETFHTVEATLFADCTGDGILAPLSGAEFRIGREAADEHGESIQPPQADSKTMGLSCILQARQTDRPQPFIPPSWARVFETCDDLPNRPHRVGATNWWWIELGGEDDSIHDAERLRDDLAAVAFGVWDHVKNRCQHRDQAANWALDWIGMLPGKRESRRYLGDHILTQNDLAARRDFPDVVAYGGWSMDDHHPGGLAWPGQPTQFHPCPSPYAIPYRSLYSRNVPNLFCAGRNISATHAAMSSTRVMATTGLMGQAVGTAAAIAVARGLTPRGVYEHALGELQQTLMDDDCFLPRRLRTVSEPCRRARLSASDGEPEALRSGIDRPTPVGFFPPDAAQEENAWTAPPGAAAVYEFDTPLRLRQARVVFDSDLNRTPAENMPRDYPLDAPPLATPTTLVRAFRIDARDGEGRWQCVARRDDNHQRLVRVDLNVETTAVRLVPEQTAGAPQARVFAFEVS